MDVKVVIGANYGDEGKGLVTNYLTREAQKQAKNVLVVLNNGGPQRGHTVVNNGIRHIFHHLGSGTLAGADTYISKNFYINPMTFLEEYDEVKKYKKFFKVYVDPHAKVTTPFEMIVNQITSKCLGVHNSCGFGIWETYKNERNFNKVRSLAWYVRRLKNHAEDEVVEFLQSKYDSLRNDVFDSVNEKLDSIPLTPNNYQRPIDECIEEYCMNINFDNLITRWIGDMRRFIDTVFIADIDEAIDGGSRLVDSHDLMIIENGQGLLLDKYYDKTHGTPSHTGAWGATEFLQECKNLNNASIELIYVTRPYLTRHGDGVMLGNEITMPDEDKTNVYNEHQGKIRCATLDYQMLFDRIDEDIEEGKRSLNNVIASNKKLILHHASTLYITHGSLMSDKDLAKMFKTKSANLIAPELICFEDPADNKDTVMLLG